MKEFRFVVDGEADEERLDKLAAAFLPDCSRSFLQKLIRDGDVLLNGKSAKASRLLHGGDELLIRLPDAEAISVEAENIPIDIVYEDYDLLVVNKARGMVVHPAPGHYDGTLVNAVLYHCHDLSGINGALRPGIVHRIDRDTSGLLVICKNDRSHRSIAEQLKEHSIERVYRAVVYGSFDEEEGTVDAPIGRDPNERKRMAVRREDPLHSKRAVTHYRVLARYDGFTQIACRLETGRTHQIRVHMTSIGHPLLGDEVYGNRKLPFALESPGQVLHAATLGFVHPSTGERMHFEAPLPEYFEKVLKKLEKMSAGSHNL
ncbi:MAG: RluA family pseudouridine synthase [Lachnospiraceae bacterium]|nr:RluA family pseudouridine synthase [Lachnospiraceae bacterium]